MISEKKQKQRRTKILTTREVQSELNYDDITLGVVWDKSDYKFIQDHFKHVRQFLASRDYEAALKMTNYMENEIIRYDDDQTPRWLYEPLSVSVKKDKVTNGGRTRAAELITGYSYKTFDYVAIGTSQVQPTDGDYMLANEIGRSSARQNGYVSPAGAVIKHVASFPPGFPTGDYWEAGVVDTASYSPDQTLFARVVFPSNRPVHHDIGESFMTIHHATNTTSSA